MGGSGVDRTDDFQKFCRLGLNRIRFYRFRTGLGLKNFPVRSSLMLLCPVRTRGEQWTELGVDWIRCMTNFVGFGLVRTVIFFINLGSRPELDWDNGKFAYFLLLKNCILSMFWILFGLRFKFLQHFGLWLDLDWSFKIPDWIWIAKYDSPLIFGAGQSSVLPVRSF